MARHRLYVTMASLLGAAALVRVVLPLATPALAPMLVIFFAAQRFFIRSVAATGLAGT